MATQAHYEQHDGRPVEVPIVQFHDVNWQDYERLLAMRGDHSAPRIAYLEGMVEIMSPSQTHEGIKSEIGRLVEVFCLEREVPFSTFGSWILKDRSRERGAEPDECYVFSEDGETAERPHLAIEVLWTHCRIAKLNIHRHLGVTEVWYWRQGHIQP
jgi:Uma2 family endonuclease